MIQRCWVLSMTLSCFLVCASFLVLQLSQCDAGLDFPFMPNVVVFSTGG